MNDGGGPTVSELRAGIAAFCETARSVQEILDHTEADREIAKRLILDMAGKKQLMIAPGTSGRMLMRGEKVREILKGMEGSE